MIFRGPQRGFQNMTLINRAEPGVCVTSRPAEMETFASLVTLKPHPKGLRPALRRRADGRKMSQLCGSIPRQSNINRNKPAEFVGGMTYDCGSAKVKAEANEPWSRVQTNCLA